MLKLHRISIPSPPVVHGPMVRFAPDTKRLSKEATMYARITTVGGATNIDEGVMHLRGEVVEQLQAQKGFRGLTANCVRETGRVSVLTLWATRDDLDASESAVEKIRREVATAFGGRAETVERYEQTVAETGPNPPTASSRLQIRRVRMDPVKVDDNVAFFQATVLPQIMAMPGCQGIRQLIDRESGEGAVGVLWADEAAMRAADAGVPARRAVAGSRGVEFGEVTEPELLFAAL
jgi:heme-degrading monooxygenase HmoA